MAASNSSAASGQVRANLFGSDGAGKTTLLYRLKLGVPVQTVPTIGFNVETIEYPEGWSISMWDSSGRDQWNDLARHYIHKDSIGLFLHDCSNPGGLESSIELLHARTRQMIDKEVKHMWVLLSKQDLVPEGDRSAVVEQLSQRFRSQFAHYNGEVAFHLVAQPGLSVRDGTHIDAVIDDIRHTLSQESGQETGANSATKSSDGQHPTEDELVMQARQACEGMLDSVPFWKELVAGSISPWDHLTHLQAGYIVLLDCLERGFGVLDSAKEFIGELNRLRNMKEGGINNMTMTIFWLLQLHQAIVNYQSGRKRGVLPSQDDYRHILSQTPSLADSRLWARYYSEDLIFSPEASKEWCPPDVCPLPDVKQPQLPHDDDLPAPPSGELSQDLKWFAFYAIRGSALLLSDKCRPTRGDVMREALWTLEIMILKERKEHSSTRTSFRNQASSWAQLVDTALQSIETTTRSQDKVEQLPFKDFESMVIDLEKPQWWEEEQRRRTPVSTQDDATPMSGKGGSDSLFALAISDLKPPRNVTPALPSPS